MKTLIPLLIAGAFVVRLIAFGASLGDALSLLSLLGFLGLQAWIDHRERKLIAVAQDDLANLRTDIDQLKSALTAIKIARSISPGGR